MKWKKIIRHLLNTETDVELCRKIANAANGGLSRILAGQGLKEGVQTREVYEHGRRYQERAWGAKWPSADELIGPEKKIKLKGTARMQRRTR